MLRCRDDHLRFTLVLPFGARESSNYDSRCHHVTSPLQDRANYKKSAASAALVEVCDL